MVTGDPGAHGALVTQKQAPRQGQGPAIIQLLQMEGPHVLDHHLQQINVIRKKDNLFQIILQVLSTEIGVPGDLGAHVTQEQAKDTDQDLAIIQQPKMEVLPVQGHHQKMKIVSYVSL